MKSINYQAVDATITVLYTLHSIQFIQYRNSYIHKLYAISNTVLIRSKNTYKLRSNCKVSKKTTIKNLKKLYQKLPQTKRNIQT